MVNPVTLEQEFNVVSEEKELRIGRNAHQQIIRQFGYYHDTAFQLYVNEIGQNLVRVCKRRDISYHFTILDDDTKNAFAVPRKAIYEDAFVYVISNGVFDYRRVDIARRESEYVIVTGGAKEGELLVTELLQGIAPGMAARAKLSSKGKES